MKLHHVSLFKWVSLESESSWRDLEHRVIGREMLAFSCINMFNIAQIFPSPGIFVMGISAKFIQLKPRKVVLPNAVSQLCSKHTSHSHRRANCSHINLQQKFHIRSKVPTGKEGFGFQIPSLVAFYWFSTPVFLHGPTCTLGWLETLLDVNVWVSNVCMLWEWEEPMAVMVVNVPWVCLTRWISFLEGVWLHAGMFPISRRYEGRWTCHHCVSFGQDFL